MQTVYHHSFNCECSFMSTCSYLLFTNIKALIFHYLKVCLSFIFCSLCAFLFIRNYDHLCLRLLFSTVATIIASPFYGLLADKVEALINGTHGDDMGVVDLLKISLEFLPENLKSSCSFYL